MPLVKSIADVVRRHSQVRLAEASDNAEILLFLDGQGMKTSQFSLSFARGEDFFKLYRLSDSKSYTFLFLNDNRSIGGIGSILLMDRQIQGEKSRVAYFCDLRIDRNASASTKKQWRDFYSQLVASLPLLENPLERSNFLFSAIFDSNERALHALMKTLGGVHFTPFYPYVAKTTILIPRILEHLGSFALPTVDERADPIEDDFWWRAAWQGHSLAPCCDSMTASYWTHLSELWPQWSRYPFLSVKNLKGRIIAFAKPWLGSTVREVFLTGLSAKERVLGRGLHLLGRPAIAEGEPLQQMYLTHMAFSPELTQKEKAAARLAMVHAAYKHAFADQVHLLSWIEERTPASLLTNAFSGLVFQVPSHLYRISSSAESSFSVDTQKSNEPSIAPTVYFEGGIF